VSTLDDDGFPSVDFIAVEEPDQKGHAQGLWIGVRPAFYGNDKSTEPMIQICYQEDYMHASLLGPVWITPETWREINKAVKWRVRYHRRKRWNPILGGFRRIGF
jgi:hypothetical protein